MQLSFTVPLFSPVLLQLAFTKEQTQPQKTNSTWWELQSLSPSPTKVLSEANLSYFSFSQTHKVFYRPTLSVGGMKHTAPFKTNKAIQKNTFVCLISFPLPHFCFPFGFFINHPSLLLLNTAYIQHKYCTTSCTNTRHFFSNFQFPLGRDLH